MKNGEYIIKTLELDNEENWLTNGNAFDKLVYLSENDSADNWKEITSEEKEEIEVQQAEEVEVETHTETTVEE